MRVLPLQSGSSGNCFYVETDRTRILIDAGISPKQISTRLQQHGRSIEQVDALLLTHDHSDHSRYVSGVCRKFGLPLHITRKTLNAVEKKQSLPENLEISCFGAGESFSVGEFQIHSIPTPHDAIDGVAFVVEYESCRLGVLTDLGHVFSGLRDVLQSLDAVIIESNYDECLLDVGKYPEFLKRRIRGSGGHLSNLDSARLLDQSASEKLQWVCLCHLSEENNSPDTAVRIHQNWLGELYPIYVAQRRQASEFMELKTGAELNTGALNTGALNTGASSPTSSVPNPKLKPARKIKGRTGQG